MNEPLAIVGMACRLPGADGLDAFWQLVVDRGVAWGPLPESRLPRDLYFHPEKSRVGKSYSEMGAVVSDRPVDPAACPITPDLERRYDIAHHIFLEVASLACRDAGLDPFAMPAARRTGVYVGHTGGSTRIGDIVYATGIDEAASLLAETAAARDRLGAAVDEVAAEVVEAVRRRYPGRRPGEKLDLGALGAAQIVHEALRLDGPFLVVDAACASSLQAMAIGARALLQGGIDQAIVGGASYCKSDSLVLFSAAQSVSNTGSCPFGAAADGLITAEGYVALVIKTLSRAIADGDRIRAVINGLGVASDGKGKSLWAPRQEGQVLAVERAYPNPSDLGRIEYIEAHATSTQVGDATELAALSRFLAPHLPAGRRIPIGSVKANIGHTLETAGIASLVKVVLALEHGVIPPGSTCTDLNEEFDWQAGPFTVPRAPLTWPAHADGSPRQAAVNAFGIGGLNVHVAVSECVPAAATPAAPAVDDDAIAIVGAGCVMPGAVDLGAFFARIDRGETAIGAAPAERWRADRALDPSGPRTWRTMSDRGGFVRDFAYDWRRHKVPPKQIAAANPLQFMLLEAADAAIADAGGVAAGLDRTRTGVVVGTLFGGDFANQLQQGLRLPETGRELRAALARRVPAAEIDGIVAAYEQKLLERMPALVDETGSFTSSTLASRLTKTFDLMGGALALDAGDCSAVAALSAAADLLRQRGCDAVLCAAGQRSLDLMAFEGLSLLGKLGAGSDQIVPGEGAVVFVLKRLADAQAAGNRIRGIIRSADVRSTAAAAAPDPTLAPIFGHTGAVSAAAETLALTAGRATGTVTVAHGRLTGRIELGLAAPPPVQAAAPAPAAGQHALRVSRPLVAALFPGQGSQYADMFRALAGESQAARSLERLDRLARSLGHETLAEIAWRPDNGLGTRIWDTQWAMYLGDLFAWDVLRDLGFEPDVVASHSFGEFPALAATAAWSREDGARATRARAEAVERHGPRNGAMLSVIADKATVLAAIEPFSGGAWVCAENAPEQFVIGGTARVVDAVEVLLEARRVKSKRLAVPSPFHTPLLAEAARDLAATIEPLPIKPPAIRTFSSTTALPYDGPAAIRTSLVRQMTDTVRWIEVVEQLYAQGARTFVEVGPSGVLTGLTRRILEGRPDCTFLQFDQRGRAAGEHLAKLCDQLAKAGAIRSARPVSAASRPAERQARPRGTVVSFDATARRRERNRQGGSQRPTPRDPAAARERTAPPAVRELVAVAAESAFDTHDTGVSNGRMASNGHGHAQDSVAFAGRSNGRHHVTVGHAEPPPQAPPAERHVAATGDAAVEIETFLIDFVVEQTGYPREIVELDADLEADLGIDSIRKAQLFGEIGQKYSLKADDGVSLDEFPTLRHLLAYMLPRVAGDDRRPEPAGAAAASPARETSVPATSAELAALLEGFDAVLVMPADRSAPRGIVATFGRHARPTVRTVGPRGIEATLVGGEPAAGAIVGWNAAGLLAFCSEPAGAKTVEELVTTCHSIDEAERMLTASGRAARGVAYAHVGGFAGRVSATGGIERLLEPLVACRPASPLSRVALADGDVDPAAAVAGLLDSGDSTGRDALSTACTWLAVGSFAGCGVACSGGPFAGRWLGADATISGENWRGPTKNAGSGPAADERVEDVTRRYALVARELGPVRVARSLAGDRVMILADRSLAESIATVIEARGGTAVIADQLTLEQSIVAVERAEEEAAVRHLIVAAPRSQDRGDWTSRRQATLTAPFFACQRWLALRATKGDLATATLTALVDLGGDFGLSGSHGGIEGGGLAGLFKGIAREFPALHVRVVDAPATLAPEAAAAAVADELQDAAGPVEVGRVAGKRITIVAAEQAPRAAPQLAALARGSVWIVTGGARGVTAECARELGRRHGLALALVGSTRPAAVDPAWLSLDDAGLRELKGRVMLEARGHGADPRSAWRTIEKSIEIERSLVRFRTAGVAARYFACDLADPAAVRPLVKEVVDRLGPVRGVLHGAGYEAACRFEKKTPEGLSATLGPKCLGLEHLLAAVDPTTLEAVVGFGSTSGRLGGHGQADYSLANDLLAKMLGARRRAGLRATVFHWHAWDEVGMASRPESRFVLEQFGLKFMPLAEGVRRFMAEVEAGLPDAEVLVTEPACVADAVMASEPEPAAAAHRGSLVADVRAAAGMTDVAFRLDPTTDRFLLDHLQFGRPLLPAVMAAELLAQAAIAAGHVAAVREIRDFVVERPLGFPTDHAREVHVALSPAAGGGVEGLARSSGDGGAAGQQRIHFRGVLRDETAPIEAAKSDPPLPFNPMVYADDAPLRHGSSFRTLTGLFLDRSGGWAKLVAPAADVVAAPRGAAGWTVPAALLDGCIVACGVYSYILCGLRVEVPVRFDRLRFESAPRSGEPCVARLVFRSNDARESLYDLVLFGADGRAILALDGLHLAIMGGEKGRA